MKSVSRKESDIIRSTGAKPGDEQENKRTGTMRCWWGWRLCDGSADDLHTLPSTYINVR